MIAAGIGGAIVWSQIEASLPPLPDPKAIATSTIVVDRDGRLLRPFTIADGRWRLPVTKDDVDPKFLKMLIGYEDQHFYEHGGVDPWALVRAAGQFVLAGGHIVSGGSTLTMQVARLIDGDSTRSVLGKLRQIALGREAGERASARTRSSISICCSRPMAATSRACAPPRSPISARSRSA